MYFHASGVKGIRILEPRISNHGVPLVYFSAKRENVLVYLSNAVEKCCKENGFIHEGPYYKWGPYGFDEDGIIRIEEYYPDALRKTYQGVGGFIYSVKKLPKGQPLKDIPDAFSSSSPVPVDDCEYIEDAYEEILKAEKEGILRILRYEQLGERMKRWSEKTIREEYEAAIDKPEYRFFLRTMFPELIDSK